MPDDGTEDDFIHCLKKRQPCEAGRQKMNSQLSILSYQNTFISPSNEEDVNRQKDYNVDL